MHKRKRKKTPPGSGPAGHQPNWANQAGPTVPRPSLPYPPGRPNPNPRSPLPPQSTPPSPPRSRSGVTNPDAATRCPRSYVVAWNTRRSRPATRRCRCRLPDSAGRPHPPPRRTSSTHGAPTLSPIPAASMSPGTAPPSSLAPPRPLPRAASPSLASHVPLPRP